MSITRSNRAHSSESLSASLAKLSSSAPVKLTSILALSDDTDAMAHFAPIPSPTARTMPTITQGIAGMNGQSVSPAGSPPAEAATRRPPPLSAGTSPQLPPSRSFSLSSPTLPSLPSSRPVLISPTSPSLTTRPTSASFSSGQSHVAGLVGGPRRRRHTGSMPIPRSSSGSNSTSESPLFSTDRFDCYESTFVIQTQLQSHPPLAVRTTSSDAQLPPAASPPAVDPKTSGLPPRHPTSPAPLSLSLSPPTVRARTASIQSPPAVSSPNNASTTANCISPRITLVASSRSGAPPQPSPTSSPPASINPLDLQSSATSPTGKLPTHTQSTSASPTPPSLMATIPPVPVMTNDNYRPSVEEQHALLTVLTTTPILLPSALASLTDKTLTLLMLTSPSLQQCLLHLHALNQLQRRFSSVIELVQAIEVAKVDGSYVSILERQKIVEYLTSDECKLFAPESGETQLQCFPVRAAPLTAAQANSPLLDSNSAISKYHRALMLLKQAGLVLDTAYMACSCHLTVFVNYCQRFNALGLRFHDLSALCHHIIAGVRPPITLPLELYESIMAFLHLPSTRSLLTSTASLTSLSQSSIDLSCLLFEGCGIEGTRLSLMRFIAMGRQFNHVNELWPAVHIQWRYGLTSTFEMRQALFMHITQNCPGLMKLLVTNTGKSDSASGSEGQSSLSHDDLEFLLSTGRGLHRTRQHCTRLHALGLSFTTIQTLSSAFYSTLPITDNDKHTMQSFLYSPQCTLFQSLTAEERVLLLRSFSVGHYSLLVYEAGSVTSLLGHIELFQSLNRSFSSFIDLFSSLQAALLSSAHSSPASINALVTLLIQCKGVLGPSLSLLSLTGKQLDTIISLRPLPLLLNHLQSFHRLQRSFHSLPELIEAIDAAFEYGYYSSETMRSALWQFLTSPQCELFDAPLSLTHTNNSAINGTNHVNESKEGKASDSKCEDPLALPSETCRLLDLMISLSGSLSSTIHHCHQFQSLAMKFSHLAQLIPSLKQVIKSGGYASKTMVTALLRYLAAPECQLLSSTSSASLTSLPAADIDELLMTGGGLLNTLKHLSRVNHCQQHFHSFAALIPAIRTARRRRLYYSSEQRQELFNYLTSTECQLFADISQSIQMTERDMERLFRYGGGMEGTRHILNELNSANKRFRSFSHLLAIVKKISAYDKEINKSNNNPSGSSATNSTGSSRALITPAQRQELINYLSSPACLLFCDHTEPIRVTSHELDALIQSTGNTQSALQGLKTLNSMGRRFPSIDDLLLAMKVMIGPHGLIALTHSERQSLIASLSYPQSKLFLDSRAPIRVNEQDLSTLIYIGGGSVESLLAHIKCFDRVSRQFSSFAELRESLEIARMTGLYSRSEERDLLKSLMTSSGNFLLTDNKNKKREKNELTQTQFELLIKKTGSFLATVYQLQLMNETLKTFQSVDELANVIGDSERVSPTPGHFLTLAPSTLSDRYQLFSLLSSPSSQLFIDASDESDMIITPLAFDLFFSRVGGIDRAIALVMGLERMERRFMSFEEMIWNVCKVSDDGIGLKEIEEFAIDADAMSPTPSHSQRTNAEHEDDDDDEEEEEEDDDDDDESDEDGDEEELEDDSQLTALTDKLAQQQLSGPMVYNYHYDAGNITPAPVLRQAVPLATRNGNHFELVRPCEEMKRKSNAASP